MKKFSKATIAAINQLKPDELEKHDVITKARSYGYICPSCGNGSGSDGTGFTLCVNGDSCVGGKCFKCSAYWTPLRLLSRHYNLDINRNFSDIIERICADFDITLEYVDFDAPIGKYKKSKRHDETPLDEKTLEFIRADLDTSTDALKKYMDAVKLWRGLPIDTLLKFKCRLIWQWTAPNVRNSSKYSPYLTPTDRMIVPCSDDAYLARMLINYKTANTEKAREFFKDKEKLHAGHKKLFNPDALTSTEPIFVVEGYIDAMTLDYAGYSAVALGAAARGDLLVDAVANMKNKPQIIILLDSDATGRENAPKLLEELIGLNCAAVVRYLSDDDSKIDCNDILVADGVDALRGRLADIVDDSIAELAALQADFDEKKAKRLNDSDLNSLFAGKDTDLANARRLEKFCGSDMRWLTDDEQWLMYQKGVWQRGSEKNSAVAHFGRALADTLTEYATTAAEKSLAEKFQSAKKISAAITLLKTLDSIRITADDLDRHSNLLNCLNGVVDLQTGILYPNVEKRSAMITQQCRAVLYKDAKSELVDNFFHDIQPDETTCAGFKRWLGYCLTAENSEEKFLVWYGRSGANGKGTIGRTLLYLLGDYATGLNQRALIRNSPFADNASKASTELNCLEKRRFALSEEIPQKSELNIELVKNLVGGDFLPIRPLYHEERTIKNYAKINISGNFLPTISNVDDGGLKRRLLQMPFTVQFGTGLKPIDYDLKRKLLLPENLSALLLLLVREAKDWYNGSGLIISDIMKQATKAQLDADNFVAEFIDAGEKFVRNDGATVKAKDFIDALKAEYPAECAKFKKQDLIRFISNVGGVEYTVDRKGWRIFKGIGKLANFTGEPFDAPPFDENDLPI